MSWEVRKEISLANIIVIIVLLFGIITAWAKMPTQAELDKKADKVVVNTNFDYIKAQLKRIEQKLERLDD